MTASATPAEFDRRAREALGDAQLHGALHRATTLFAERRRNAMASVGDWESARERARAIKDETLLHLDRYLEQFAAAAERAGAVVHWARDAREACAIIGGIARARGARTVVKSKSMATEEIHLNAALAAGGLEPVETDLGEYIIQLAGETPSHIVVPAIHKTRGQIAALLAAKLGIAVGDDVASLTAAARTTLRQRFAAADLGISGVNFGVAETGTILILENEGNARLTITLPRTHIALMGIEKVIPRVADLDVFLQLLPRSGTGQALTTYQSLITGRRPASADGPDELHIVLLDNGRSAMLARAVTRQALACIRCGACLNACPVYQQIGGHAYGSVYPGPIGAVITPQLAGLHEAAALPYASSLCGACRDACPVKIDIPALLLHLRGSVVERRAAGPRRGERLAFRLYRAAMARPALYLLAARLMRAAQRLLGARADGALAARLVPPLGAWTAWRDLRPVARRSFRDEWSHGLGDAGRGGSETK
ncbi:MAG TPA: LutB/LldF family L-lactate oxidation iron-sulfur protein [Gemmatimonadaceae bacterium]